MLQEDEENRPGCCGESTALGISEARQDEARQDEAQQDIAPENLRSPNESISSIRIREAHDEVMLTESMKDSSSISGKFTGRSVTVALSYPRPKPQQATQFVPM